VGVRKTRNGYSLHTSFVKQCTFHSSASALAVTNLCFPDTHEAAIFALQTGRLRSEVLLTWPGNDARMGIIGKHGFFHAFRTISGMAG
jgi:hypothetical protein